MVKIKEDKFNFFIPIDSEELEKAKGKTGAARYDNMMVQGVASDSSKDTDGEHLLPAGYELDRFKKFGFINYDHRAKDNPKYYIGEPTEAKVEKNKFFVKGKLYKKSQIARDLWDTMILLDESDSTRKVGWSIEGKALSRDLQNPKIIKRALITGVALTLNPKNSNSFATICKGQYTESFIDYEYSIDELEKSDANGGKITYLVDIIDHEAGIRYTIDKDLRLKVEKAISTTSAQALIKESLDKKLKNLSFGSKDLKRLVKANEDGEISVGLFNEAKDKIKGILEDNSKN